MASLSKKKRQKVIRRATKEARRENAASTAPARAAMGQAKRDYGRAARDVRGAQRVYSSQLGGLMRKTRGSNLGGKYKGQIMRDLMSRQAEAAAGVPYGLTIARQDRNDAMATARADMAAAQSSLQEDIGTKTNDLLEAARKAKTSRMEDRRSDAEEGKGDNRGVKNAMLVAKTYLDNAKPKERKQLLGDLPGFAIAVAADAEGADGVDAKRAIRILMRKIHKANSRFDHLNPFGG